MQVANVTLDGVVVNPYGVPLGKHLSVRDGVVTRISGRVSEDAIREAQTLILPAVIDTHCHGGYGFSYSDGITVDQIRELVHAQRLDGTTHSVASLVSMRDPLPAIEVLVQACEQRLIAGIHLEGPFVAPSRSGAQNRDAIRPIDLEELGRWLRAGRGHIRSVTLAPELAGALEAATLMMKFGARPAWGHTDVADEQIRGIMADVREQHSRQPSQIVTHLFNAMPSVHHRNPGPIPAFLTAAMLGDVVVEIIGDGVHIEPKLASDIVHMLDDPHTPGAMLVTDGIAGMGQPDGHYDLGGLSLEVVDGTTRIAGTGTLAGGTATMLQQCQVLDRFGADPDVLVRAVCAAPIRALNLGIPAGISVGRRFTGVVVDERWNLQQVYVDGHLLSDS